MRRTRKQSVNPQKQSTLSKFFSSSDSKLMNRKRDASEDASPSSDQPTKLAKLESLALPNVHKESLLLNTTADRLKQFSYQEDVEQRNYQEKSIDISEISGVSNCNDFIEKTPHSSNSCHVSEHEDNDMTGVHESNLKEKCDLPKKTKFTPLEQQYLDFKKDYPDAILFIECGYKYRLFGEDAQIASKVLNIGCYISHNFHCSSIPTHRLSVHVRRLVANGHKVGVIKQTETAALKAAGDNKNTLFTRKLHALYTTSTLIGEDFNAVNDRVAETDDENSQVSALSGYLACIYDNPSSLEKTATVSVGIMAVNPTSGDVLYASFDDTVSRSELESYLTQINPIEMILPESALTDKTENLIRNFCEISSLANRKIRIEKLADALFDYAHALNNVSEFFENSDVVVNTPVPNNNRKEILSGVLNLSPVVICCISSLISYLAEFHLEILLKNSRQWQSLSTSSTNMALNGAAVRNLEILQNSVDGLVYGSLLWTLNFTRTKFGEKLLKSWLTKPLKDPRVIEERLDAVTEVVHSQSSIWSMVEKLLVKLPDLEKLLCAAFYHRCTCSEFITLVTTLTYVKKELGLISEKMNLEVQGSKVKDMIFQAIVLLNNVESFSGNINEKAARDEDKTKLFLDTSKYIAVAQCEANIRQVEEKLSNLKRDICRTLHLLSFSYVTVMGQQYLIEVKNSQLSLVPSNWMKISSTKQVSRFRSPEVESHFTELRQLSEELKQHCMEAWNSLLDEFSHYFYKYKQVVSYLAQLDCIMAFAKFAKQEGFCRPILTDSINRKLNIIQGRNPIVAKLLGERFQYVANDTKFDGNKRCMVITGPNMGGKSSYVRQVALISILAQAGSYVPAVKAELPIFDGIYVRMGADDDVVRERRSTFFTEMLETSGILSKASDRSLVILDELGRGTSTHDGSAIAHATLNHLVDQVKCMTLFVTHYPLVASQLQNAYLENILCCHLSFLTDDNSQDDTSEIPDVTFLYSLAPGIASKSYGINVARLAGIDSEILTKATEKSFEFEDSVKRRRFMHSVVKSLLTCDISGLKNAHLQLML